MLRESVCSLLGMTCCELLGGSDLETKIGGQNQ